jgi:serine/threonine protein kinase
MANLDAVALADKALRLGLLKLVQLQEGWDEVGQRGGEAEPLVQVLERKGHLTPWQSQKLLKDDPDGYFLGGYRILYKIASGSFGRVYRADDPNTGTVVAIKVLRRKWSDDQHQIDLFEREGKVGMALKHPNIVEILAVNRDVVSRQYYIVMEFVEGGNLRDILAIRKKLEAAEALRFLEDAASGLAYAFGHGISHRDMKLTNILISSHGVAKLVDFGLTEIYSKGQMDEDAHVDRTVDYAGLEKATNVPKGDARSDLFFLGCVAYELLAGRPPLNMSRKASDRMQSARFANVPKLTPEEIGGSPAVIRLVETMMSVKPLERFQTPSQLLDAIRVLRGELQGRGTSGAYQGPRTLFLAEKDERLQDILRDKLKELGFRVLIAADPLRALDRFRQQPFDVLVVDAMSTGADGMLVFERIMNDADRQQARLHGILLLSDEQTELADKLVNRPNVAVLVQPIKLKQLLRTIKALQA